MIYFILFLLGIFFTGCTSTPAEAVTPTTALVQTPTTAPSIVPTELPTNTPLPTELPTNTPLPTELPTNTPLPTELPTNTPLPTELPTNTPLPTEPPTNTPLPTEPPTNTPLPTATPTPVPTTTPTEAPDFYHVEGTSIVDSCGNPVWLKGIAFGNMIWSSFDPTESDHNEDSFRELSELGFNCARFYLSYHYFEDDSTPYEYKESGFEWLDRNIAWAKKYNIRLILNMHAPQGGYQSQGEGLALWQDPENQDRLIALWTEIARRYADEETIIGFGLINEPVVPMLDTLSATTAQCASLMQRITDSIRVYNQNHIIFAEHVCGMVDTTTGAADWNISLEDLQYLIDDDNTVYEFHFYTPHQFTHQNMDWAGTAGTTVFYPSDEPVFQNPVSYWVGCGWSEQTDTLEDGWVIYESGFSARTDEYNAGSITLQAARTGTDGSVLFDDIVIEEYQDGKFQRIVKELDFETIEETDDFYFWSADESGSYIYVNDGYQGSRCVAMCGTTGDANISGYRFELREGCEYRIRAKVKYVNVSDNVSARPRIDYSLFENITHVDLEYLKTVLLPRIEFGTEHQVPVYLGEFGVSIPAWSNGGGAWVTDMLTICAEYQLHFDYHAYHDYWFGLYRSSPTEAGAKRNEELAAIFLDFLKE